MNPPVMKLTHRTVENVHILEISGNLMHHDVAHVTQQLHQIVTLHNATPWLIDLTELQHIDIHGLSVLLIILKLTHSTGGNVVILNPNEIVNELLTLTNLHRLFAIYADKTAALADLTQHSLSFK